MEKITLDQQDWESLFTGATVAVGKKILVVRPYSIMQLAQLKSMLRGIATELKNAGITRENFTSEEAMSLIFNYAVANCPVLIEEACGLDREDVMKLPVATGLALVTAIINVNLDSQEGLFEALQQLGKLLAR